MVRFGRAPPLLSLVWLDPLPLPSVAFRFFGGEGLSLFPPLREGHPKMKKMEETRGWRTVGSEEERIEINMEEGTGAIR